LKPVKEAKKYAKTFINIVGLEEAPSALVELALVENLMTKNKDFRSLLLNPAFSQTDREGALKQLASKVQLSEKIVNFVIHLTEVRVIVALSQIVKMATAIYLEKKRQGLLKKEKESRQKFWSRQRLTLIMKSRAPRKK
jgi:F0F1-type ATP synthase delta subunit